MSNPPEALLCASLSHDVAWFSLVSRSVAAWDNITTVEKTTLNSGFGPMLEGFGSLDNFLVQGPFMFWFFQKRSAFMSQERLKKWSRDELDDYILLPALPGYVMRADCFFVSHFWRTQEHPDPDGEYLRLHQAELEPQAWSYIWVDWTCMPQSPRSLSEESYFYRCLRTMSAIIRNCGFISFYPPFEPRLWILYEITEYVLTCDGGMASLGPTPDIKLFLEHVNEMCEKGVQATLAKYSYRCSYDRDRQYLTSWLELLVLLKQLHFGVDPIRQIMDNMTWFNVSGPQFYSGIGMELNRYEGTLVLNGEIHTFTPFPQYDEEKYWWVPETIRPLQVMADCGEEEATE